MLRPLPYITVTKDSGEAIEFNFVHSFEIEESSDHLTDTAIVTLPRKLTQSGVPLFTGADPIFKRKDKIKIEAGYFPNREVLFEGFISHVSANIPVQLECENYMFLFKLFKVTYPTKRNVRTVSKTGRPLKHPVVTSENISLGELMSNVWREAEYNDLVDDITYEIVDDINLGQFRATNATPAQIFDKLRDEYGLSTYFVGRKLYIGFANNARSTVEKEYVMEDVCINSNYLQYQRAEDIIVKAKCVSMLPNNTKIEAEAGDEDGEQRTYHYYNITSQAELLNIAEQRVKDQKYTGFRGWFETFGQPYLQHGDLCKIVSRKLPERNGSYLIRSVRRRFGVAIGYRQSFELAEKVA